MIRHRFKLTKLASGRGRGGSAERLLAESQAMVMARQLVPRVSFPDALPVSQHLETITETIRGNQVVIIAGETGSGKTTQLPKMCLNLGRGFTAPLDTPSRAEWPREQWPGDLQRS